MAIVFMLASLLSSQFASAAPETEGPTMHHMRSETANLRYVLTLPAGFDAEGEQRPLIVFLHGSGQRGIDLELVERVSVAQVYDAMENFPFVTISPQCPPYLNWYIRLDSVVILIEEAIQNYNIDPDRVYLTGVSMGGHGVWALAFEHPEKFAAIAPISGFGTFPDFSNFIDIPVWAFHGEIDSTVSLALGQAPVNALREAGGNVEFTIVPDRGHDIADSVFNNAALYEWFLTHIRSGTPAQTSRPEITPKIIDMPASRIAYVRAFGETGRETAINTIRAFSAENNLIGQYFGFNITQDASGEVHGFEAWVILDSEDVSPTDNVNIKNFNGGRFAVYPAWFNPDFSRHGWESIQRWARSGNYQIGINAEMQELLFDDEGVQIGYNFYVSIEPRDDLRNILIGIADYGYSETGLWQPFGSMRTSTATGDARNYAQWTPNIQMQGFYRVSVLRPSHPMSDPFARLDITFSGGADTLFIDYTVGYLEWVELGIYRFDEGRNGYVRVSGTSPDRFVRASSMKFEFVEEIYEFADTPGHWGAHSIRNLTHKGIVSGFGDGTFRPEANVTIDQFIRMIVTSLGHQLENGEEYWASPFIDKAMELGIINDGDIEDFTLPITRGQTAQMLDKATNYNVEIGALITDLDRPNDNMTRAEGAEVIFRLINPGRRIQLNLPIMQF